MDRERRAAAARLLASLGAEAGKGADGVTQLDQDDRRQHDDRRDGPIHGAWRESPLFILNNLEAIGPAVRLAGVEGGGVVVMPALKVKDFDFTSLSDAV
ncbi:MAG: hypothetical protein DMD35_18070 [Gemmatimonadetes bacterium]|nr:MAG: hypothetical protein DMD35_18070 [Gemmatimonadota bacterium]